MGIAQEFEDLPYAGMLVPHDGVWSPRADYDTVHFGEGAAEDVDASGSRFMECAFTGTAFEGGRLRRARFLEVWGREMRFVGTDLAETSWQDGTLLGSVAAGAQVYSAELTRVVFQGCKLDAVNFRTAKLTDVTFDNCLLRNVDFGGATMTRVRFPDCKLSKVDLTKVTLDQVDFRGAQLDLALDPGSMRGAIIGPDQLFDLAPMLAAALGIVVD